MKNNINKYFAGELTSGEKNEFLLEVIHDGGLQEDFLESGILAEHMAITYPVSSASASGSTNRLVGSERG